jgi:hypothetical protein
MKYAREVAFAFLIVTAYSVTLRGPSLLGIQNGGLALIVAGLGGYTGMSVVSALLAGPGFRRKRVRWILAAICSVLAAVLLLGHVIYYNGRTEYGDRDLAVFLVSLFFLALAMRAFWISLARVAGDK